MVRSVISRLVKCSTVEVLLAADGDYRLRLSNDGRQEHRVDPAPSVTPLLPRRVGSGVPSCLVPALLGAPSHVAEACGTTAFLWFFTRLGGGLRGGRVGDDLGELQARGNGGDGGLDPRHRSSVREPVRRRRARREEHRVVLHAGDAVREEVPDGIAAVAHVGGIAAVELSLGELVPVSRLLAGLQGPGDEVERGVPAAVDADPGLARDVGLIDAVVGAEAAAADADLQDRACRRVLVRLVRSRLTRDRRSPAWPAIESHPGAHRDRAPSTA